ncbi:MAG: pseudouridine synthase [Zetaproteobacteria bacterium CG_4_9_14_3_um_filter_49_83]|nr:MAG: pseudouridine synthase [Zetaproteobacteria bacterium CG1_02_49_23]PIQ34312.1 MAG: pseudouridine synthase [Zetaproteobacteria bacterium CG17_big_fil_post_rev_8_21_14_2_50_50_13]PIV29749.1 MAG: pseudouridine synthase [Zetaproteobacteria bacterium CG02_land_8_20_14_3_00_50_9]PIY57223.1 MAG: pseudouridine synthase [Zetaproteobacteria bacterium CG_4_10_14_0_8_um_filter_49_80]PJA35434.1 MAG: pseudouridine synthase [Zetaproteobacteria bacterium CG_4_9_14_3_um_filter_49_83]
MLDYIITIKPSTSIRLDKALAEFTPLSRRRIRQAIDDGGVYINNQRCRTAGRMLKGREKLRILTLDEEVLIPFVGEEQLLWQQNGLYLIHKRSGQYAQEALHRSKGTLPDELARFLAIPPLRAKYLRPVHRLDRGTSGLMLFSEHPAQLQHLQQHWHSHVQKRYLAWVSPAPSWDEQNIELAISKQRDTLGRYHTDPENGPLSRACSTTAMVRQRLEDRALLELIPHTGRTHQLRVHLQALGCPILGDSRYGGKRHSRLMLHAYALKIHTPALPETMEWTAEPEGDWL